MLLIPHIYLQKRLMSALGGMRPRSLPLEVLTTVLTPVSPDCLNPIGFCDWTSQHSATPVARSPLPWYLDTEHLQKGWHVLTPSTQWTYTFHSEHRQQSSRPRGHGHVVPLAVCSWYTVVSALVSCISGCIFLTWNVSKVYNATV